MASTLAKQFGISSRLMGEKPHSSVSDWIEVLSTESHPVDDYDGIPELVEAINLQAEGPVEASRAIRKKLKYGNIHRQLRALTLLKALVENCGPKFQGRFADHLLLERLKFLATDPLIDDRVRRRTLSLFASWHREFKDNASMRELAGLWTQYGGANANKRNSRIATPGSPTGPSPEQLQAEEAQRARAERKAKEKQEKEEEKRRMKAEKEKRAKGAKSPTKPGAKRRPFDFEKEKPQILTSVASASQASNNLINALKLVNREQDSIVDNERVQECLAKAKAERKVIVRYIQLVEQEELIGTLLDANERIISSLQLYELMLKPASQDSDDERDESAQLAARMGKTTLAEKATASEFTRSQEKQRAFAPARAASDPSGDIFSDLRDLSFGGLGQTESNALPPPLRPSAAGSQGDREENIGLGSLSDYSDYNSSDEEVRENHTRHSSGAGTSRASGAAALRNWVRDSDDEDADVRVDPHRGLLVEEEDPFADPTESKTSLNVVGRA